MRRTPNVSLSPCSEAYARLLTQGFDTVQESFDLRSLPHFVELLDERRDAAASLSRNLDATVECELNGEKFKVHATGARGAIRWRLENDDFLIFIATPNRDWSISVRYLSAGLWEHGLEALRQRAINALAPNTRRFSSDFIRVTRADWCFDFYSPAFTEEIAPRLAESVVIHSSTKDHIAGKFEIFSRGPRGETLTIGSKASLEVQIYDKTREIVEQSGKTWLYPLWLNGLQCDPWSSRRPRDIWRLECRFGREFLKQRNLRTPQAFKRALGALVREALYTRRLCVPRASDTHRHRWPLHPLWSEAARQFNATGFVPIGRKVTGRRYALLDSAEASLAGAIRSAIILEKGEFRDCDVDSLFERVRARLRKDPSHTKQKVVTVLDRGIQMWMRRDDSHLRRWHDGVMLDCSLVSVYAVP